MKLITAPVLITSLVAYLVAAVPVSDLNNAKRSTETAALDASLSKRLGDLEDVANGNSLAIEDTRINLKNIGNNAGGLGKNIGQNLGEDLGLGLNG